MKQLMLHLSVALLHFLCLPPLPYNGGDLRIVVAVMLTAIDAAAAAILSRFVRI